MSNEKFTPSADVLETVKREEMTEKQAVMSNIRESARNTPNAQLFAEYQSRVKLAKEMGIKEDEAQYEAEIRRRLARLDELEKGQS